MRAAGRLAAMAFLLASAASAGAEDAGPPGESAIDASNARVEFEIAALWVLRRHGHFGHIDGRLRVDPQAGVARIEVRIRVDSVQMKDPDHVRLLLSPVFFDAERHPWIEFESEPFALSGEAQAPLAGHLRLRGVRRKVHFELDRRACLAESTRPCEVTVSGSLRRARFGMTGYRRTLSDKVHLRIVARLPE